MKISENPYELVRHHLKIREKSVRHNPKICKILLKIRENQWDINWKSVKIQIFTDYQLISHWFSRIFSDILQILDHVSRIFLRFSYDFNGF